MQECLPKRKPQSNEGPNIKTFLFVPEMTRSSSEAVEIAEFNCNCVLSLKLFHTCHEKCHIFKSNVVIVMLINF